MIVRLAEAALPAAFEGANCKCKQKGGCDVPAAVPVALSEHVDFIEGIGAWSGTEEIVKKLMRDYNPASRRRLANRAGKMGNGVNRNDKLVKKGGTGLVGRTCFCYSNFWWACSSHTNTHLTHTLSVLT